MDTAHLSPADIPRLPIFGWHTFSSQTSANLPSLLDAKNLCYTTSGRAAIALALEVLAVPKDSIVLLPTYHCPTMVAPIEAHGATPMFYPLKKDGSPNLEWLNNLPSHNISALLLPHYFGLPQPIAKIRAFCDERGIYLIEDCAHALFGEADERPIGSWGDVAIASLTKFLPVSEGGLLVSQHRSLKGLQLQSRGVVAELKALIDILEIGVQHQGLSGLNFLLRSAFALKKSLRKQSTSPAIASSLAPPSPTTAYSFDPNLIHALPTRVTRFLAKHAARSRIIERRQANFNRLAALFAKDEVIGLRPLRMGCPPNSAPYVFPLWVTCGEEIYSQVRQTGLGLFRWDWLWPQTPQIEGDQGLKWSRHIFQLPCHQDLRDSDLQCIAKTIRDICRKHSSLSASTL